MQTSTHQCGHPPQVKTDKAPQPHPTGRAASRQQKRSQAIPQSATSQMAQQPPGARHRRQMENRPRRTVNRQSPTTANRPPSNRDPNNRDLMESGSRTDQPPPIPPIPPSAEGQGGAVGPWSMQPETCPSPIQTQTGPVTRACHSRGDHKGRQSGPTANQEPQYQGTRQGRRNPPQITDPTTPRTLRNSGRTLGTPTSPGP